MLIAEVEFRKAAGNSLSYAFSKFLKPYQRSKQKSMSIKQLQEKRRSDERLLWTHRIMGLLPCRLCSVSYLPLSLINEVLQLNFTQIKCRRRWFRHLLKHRYCYVFRIFQCHTSAILINVATNTSVVSLPKAQIQSAIIGGGLESPKSINGWERYSLLS